MKAVQSFATWVEVDLKALKKNIKILQKEIGVPLMTVVKANTCGHGYMPITSSAEEAGVDWFGVARPHMALKMCEEGIEQMICLDISLTAWNEEHIVLVEKDAANCKRTACVHLLIDSGMGRLGCLPKETLCLDWETG